MNYLYEALDESGKVVLGKIDAVNEADVYRKLQQLGYRPQTIAPTQPVGGALDAPTGSVLAPVQTGAPAAVASRSLPAPVLNTGSIPPRTGGIIMAGNAAQVAARTRTSRTAPPYTQTTTSPLHPKTSTLGGVSTRDLMFFFQQLSSLVKSGITIYAALENLAARTPNRNLATAAREMAAAAHAGGRISDVMEHYPRIFPDHIAGTVRAGETGGFLEIALSETALNYEQNIALYRGSWIPKLMAAQSLYVLALALPLFPCLLATFNMATNIRLYLRAELFFLPGAFAIQMLIKAGSRRLQLPQFRRLRDSWALRMPPFGDLQRQAAIAAFVRMLRKLYHAGVSPIHAWEGAMNTASNVVIRDRLTEAYALMQRGASLPEAFAATGLFASTIENLILTGHQSGEVVESLDQIADYYQAQVAEAAGRSRFMMLRLGILAMLILGGGAMIWMMHTYFQRVFGLVDENFSPDGGMLWPWSGR